MTALEDKIMEVDTTAEGQITELETETVAVEPETSTPAEDLSFEDAYDPDNQDDQPKAKENGSGKEKTEESDPKPTGIKGIDKSFARLTRQRTEAREMLAMALEENAKLRAQLQTAPKPREQYGSEQEYFEDQVNRAMAQRDLQRVEQQAYSAHDAYQASLNASWAEQEAEAKTRYADYEEVVTKSQLPVSQVLRSAILESPAGADIAYALGKNPDALRYLNASSQREVDRYIARLEAQIEMVNQSAHAPVAQAPAAAPVQKPAPVAAPATPRVARPAAAPAKKLEDLEGDDYLRAYKERLKAKRAKQ